MKKYHFQPDVWTLLRRNVSQSQMLGYIVANIVGLSVILAGLLFYMDSNTSQQDDDQFFSRDYLVLSKKVDGMWFTPVAFSHEEIAKLKQQSWVRKVGEFTASQFAVNGAVSLGGKGLSTYLFFESVPDEFFDIKPRRWAFDPQKPFVPIILCKDYLTLYNFGFALPQGMPQISEDIIGAIPISLHITGKDQTTDAFEASVVGFSSRLNTIAVPQSFMDWANAHYADGEKADPSRLIVEVDRRAASEMNQYLSENDIEVAGDKADDGKLSAFLGLVSMVVTTGGVVISLLAIFILLLSIFLLLQKSRDRLRSLMLLGFSPREVGLYYERIVAVANLGVTIVALALSLLSRMAWAPHLRELGLGGHAVYPIVIVAIAYYVGVTALNIYIIRRHLIRIWYNKA